VKWAHYICPIKRLTNLTMCKLNNRYHDTYGLTPHLCVDCETIEVDHIDWMCETCLTNYNTGNDVDPWINYTPAETAEYIKRFKDLKNENITTNDQPTI